MADNPHAFTVYGWICCLWILVVSFQYGYHISALNQIQAVLTCARKPDAVLSADSGLPTCIPVSDATFSVVTSVYTVGGLLGSLIANVIMDRWGRKGAVRASSAMFVLGSALMGVSASLWPLIIGRTLVGVGAGFGLCVGPIFLSEIAPNKIQGAVGVLTQFAIVIGIMITQAMGLKLATPHQWRQVLYFSAALSFVQLVFSPLIVESPVWLHRRGLLQEKAAASRKLWEMHAAPADVADFPVPVDTSREPLLNDVDVEHDGDDIGRSKNPEDHQAAISLLQLLTTAELRTPLIIVCFSMLCQQLSGVNAVLYYSNNILSKALPDAGPFISLGITIVNVIMTFPPIFLIERLGRKTLLALSATGAFLSLIGVGFGLDSGLVTLASITILTFVASFAIGIGPVPFVMIPEVSPLHAVSALSSVGLSLNWVANFLVGLVFLPLRDLLAKGDPMKAGRIFYVFATLLGVCTLVLFKFYRG